LLLVGWEYFPAFIVPRYIPGRPVIHSRCRRGDSILLLTFLFIYLIHCLMSIMCLRRSDLSLMRLRVMSHPGDPVESEEGVTIWDLCVVGSTAQSSCGIQVILRDRRGGVEVLRLEGIAL
jgi:hypothetical protein